MYLCSSVSASLKLCIMKYEPPFSFFSRNENMLSIGTLLHTELCERRANNGALNQNNYGAALTNAELQIKQLAKLCFSL